MAITLAEELPKQACFSESGGSLAYFFCDSNSEDRRTAIAVTRGLLYQLIKQRPQLLRYLQLKYEERQQGLFASFDALWAVFINMATDQASGKKYIIIDALDDCDMEAQDILMRQINLTFQFHDFDPCLRRRPFACAVPMGLQSF